MIRLALADVAAADRLAEALHVAAGARPGTARAAEWRALAAEVEAGIDHLPSQYPARDPEGSGMDQSVMDRWRELTREADNGHLTWVGETASDRRTPVLRVDGRTYTARRIAYWVRHNVEPRGQAKADCGQPYCVAPDHQFDTADRQDTHPRHRRYVTAEAKLATLVRPVDGGHLEWTGTSHRMPYGGTSFVPAKVAFVAHYGREPVGLVRAGCGHDGCLRGDHLDDRPAREKLAALAAALGI